MNIPYKCPSCSGKMVITELCCSECKTTIKGNFEPDEFSALDYEEKNFLKIFIASGGNIKEMEKRLGISYPTVKARLEHLIIRLGLRESRESMENMKKKKIEIIEKLEKGEIRASDAVKQLKETQGDE
ncbi:MAG: DUF2089 domain-containing protein [Elusimicrobia bacterium]|nr:DUF2089 domain-containing protein [Elusimicrobiota bacterium]